MLSIGASAPDVNLPDLDGAEWNLDKALGYGPVVLVFFKISCPTCQLTFPYLQRIADSPAVGPQLIAISQDDVPDSREFQQRVGVSMRTLIDASPHYSASNAYAITSVPSFFVVETDGRIAAAFDGFNKAALEKIGERFQIIPFRESDHVPTLRPG